MNELYFENIGKYGNLYLEKVLFEYEGEPIIFICSNDVTKFICNCYEFRNDLKWFICQTNNEIILDIIENVITLREGFLISGMSKYTIILDNNEDIIANEILNNTEIDFNILPTEGIGLKTNVSNITDYVSQIKDDNKSKHKISYSWNYAINCYQELNNSTQFFLFDNDIFENLMTYNIKEDLSCSETVNSNLSYLISKFGQSVTQYNNTIEDSNAIITDRIKIIVDYDYSQENVLNNNYSKVA